MHAHAEQELIEKGLSLIVDDLLTVREKRDVDVVRMLRIKKLAVADVATQLGVSTSRVRDRKRSGERFLYRVGTGEVRQPNCAFVPPSDLPDGTLLRDTVLYFSERVLNALRFAGITTVGEARRFLVSGAHRDVKNCGPHGIALLAAAVGIAEPQQAKKPPQARWKQPKPVLVRKIVPPVPGGPQFERVVVTGKDARGRLIFALAPDQESDG
jgi:hypothetical protein